MATTRAERGPGRRLLPLVGAGALMLLPVLALRWAEGAAGDPGDYLFLFILFAGLALAVELSARAPQRAAYAVGAGLAVLAALLLA